MQTAGMSDSYDFSKTSDSTSVGITSDFVDEYTIDQSNESLVVEKYDDKGIKVTEDNLG